MPLELPAVYFLRRGTAPIASKGRRYDVPVQFRQRLTGGAIRSAKRRPSRQLLPKSLPGQPVDGLHRAREANREFVAVAKDFGWLPAGAKAHYFAGVTFQELGQTGSAETELKTAAGSWDRNLANLAKLALAGLYQQTGRTAQAIDVYNDLAKKPSLTVPTSVAQLDLADLYASTGKQDQARALWAKSEQFVALANDLVKEVVAHGAGTVEKLLALPKVGERIHETVGLVREIVRGA